MTVTAPPATQARLLALQSLDDELARIAAHRGRLQAAVELRAARTAAAEARRLRVDRSGEAEDLRTRLARVESDGAVVAQRLERDRSRLASSTSVRDVAGLEQEIAALLRRRGVLEEDELDLMERLEAAEAAFAAADAASTDADGRAARLTGDRDEALAGLARHEEQVRGDRDALASDLPADLVALYDRQRTRYGTGAALLTRGVSGGSGMALTGADLAAVRAAAPDAVVLDPESGCILVRTDESGLG